MDHNETSIKAALAMAAIANSCKEVPGEPRCAELEALREAGWKVELQVDDKDGHVVGFNLTFAPPKGSP
jgi:hypothetical protein